MTTDLVIEAEGLVKRFGATTALRGVDLAIPRGTVLGVLGPNGAGKTTAVRILSTLLVPDAGSARIAGYDVVREADRVRETIGLTGQYASVDEDLTGRQNLELFGTLLDLGRSDARRRAAELLEWFQLAEAADLRGRQSPEAPREGDARPAPGYAGGRSRVVDPRLLRAQRRPRPSQEFPRLHDVNAHLVRGHPVATGHGADRQTRTARPGHKDLHGTGGGSVMSGP
ncbi:MAG: oleandomycin transport system ATP-binding protein [Actinomycetota bacterium]|nr:oleandomycin transport system ATP-binding protein [Actinomycetota bacterium]